MHCSRILAGYKERDFEVNFKEEMIRQSQLWITLKLSLNVPCWCLLRLEKVQSSRLE